MEQSAAAVQELSCAGVPLLDPVSREGQGPAEEPGTLAFGSVRPWAGNMQPPDTWNPRTLNPRTPDVTLELDFVYGYRSRQAHNNLHWVDEPRTILYHSAGVAVVCDISTRTQRYFREHEDDILCLDYCPAVRLAASGGLGKRNTAPIMVWDVDTMKARAVIRGTLQFGVLGVAFSVDGSRIFGIGSDNGYTVAVFDVGTGACLASSVGDRNRIVHIIGDTTIGRDSKRNFITVGVSHIKFWQKLKNKEEFVGKKAIGADISKQTFASACCTLQHVIVGSVGGGLYVFTEGVLARVMADAHTSFVGALTSHYNTVYSGGRDGLLKTWNFELPDGKCEGTVDLNPHSMCSAGPQLVDGKMRTRGNGPRAICMRNNRLLVGTQFGSIYTVTDGDVQTVLESHFEETPGTMPELWGLGIHPTEPLFCSVSDDATLRLWGLDLGAQVLMTGVAFPARCCAFSADGASIVVGHSNGAFSVWDSVTLTAIVSFTRLRQHRCVDARYSPCGRWLAIAMATVNVVDIFDVKRDYAPVGVCQIGSATITHIDWNVHGTLLQVSTAGYELVTFNVPFGTTNCGGELCNEVWATHTATLGWGVQGIWADCSDGTDVNCCGRSNNMQWVVAGYDFCKIRLFNYPCLPRFMPEFPTRPVFPAHRELTGHSSHVTAVRWSPDDRYVLTAGGMDLTILRWKVVPVAAAAGGAQQAASPLLATSMDIATAAEDVAAGRIREMAPVRRTPTPTVASQSQTVSRRPFSSNAHVQSRLLQPTASADSKARSGRLHREHVLHTASTQKKWQAL